MDSHRTIQRGLLCCVLILLVGCRPDQSFGKASLDAAPGDPDIEFSIDIALQRSAWGTSIGRCHLQAAVRIYEPPDEDMSPYGEAGGTILEVPDDPLTCAHTIIEEQGEPIEIGGEGDNWAIAGEDIAAEEIILETSGQTIVLTATELESGSIRYEWEDCDQERFPFGKVLDLKLPDSDGAFIPGFTIDAAFAVGPDFEIVEPQTAEPRIEHNQSTDLTLAWDDLHEMPRVRGENVSVERMIWARNRHMDDHQPFEALGCLPDNSGMTIGADQLRQLQGNAAGEEASVLLGIQIDTVVTSPAFLTPWGRTISVRSTVSDGGDLLLFE